MDVPAGTLVITAALGIPEIPAKTHETTGATGEMKKSFKVLATLSTPSAP